MRTALLIGIIVLGMSTGICRAEGMLAPDASDANIPVDCRAVAQVLVQLARQKATSTPEQLQQAALKLLTEKGYKGSFGATEFIAPFYAGMTLQSPPEVDRFMAEATKEQLAQMEEEEEIACVKEALIDLSNRPPTDDASPAPSPAAKPAP